MKNLKQSVPVIFLCLLLFSCDSVSKSNSIKDLNLIDFLVPEICQKTENCNLIYFQTEEKEGFNFTVESVLEFKKDTVFIDYKVINPRSSIYNQKFILVHDRYYSTYHSIEAPEVNPVNFNIVKGDYFRTNKKPFREMEANVHDVSPLSIYTVSKKSRLFDTIYNNELKKALEVKGKFNYKGFEFLNKTNFIETMIEGIGTISFIEREGSDTTFNTVLDSLVLVERKELKAFP